MGYRGGGGARYWWLMEVRVVGYEKERECNCGSSKVRVVVYEGGRGHWWLTEVRSSVVRYSLKTLRPR